MPASGEISPHLLRAEKGAKTGRQLHVDANLTAGSDSEDVVETKRESAPYRKSMVATAYEAEDDKEAL